MVMLYVHQNDILMTLKGKTNHYNIKFLSGYGSSVSLKDNKIVLKNGTCLYFDTQDQEEWKCFQNKKTRR